MLSRKICCIGANEIGVPFSAVIAVKCPHIEVTVIDKFDEKIGQWYSPTIPLPEPGLEEIIRKCRDKNLFFSSNAKKVIDEAELIFICENTPLKTQGEGQGRVADLKPLEDAARLIAHSTTFSKIVVEKSTVPIRAAETVSTVLNTTNEKEKHFTVLSNPEFLTEGTAVNDILNPERVLIGGDDTPKVAQAIESLIRIYEHWVPRSKIVTSDTWSSELAKLATNAFLAQRIASINSLSEVCEATNADVSEVATAIGMDSRLGPKGLEASIGFGGSSFYKDILNIVYLCESLNLPQVATYWQKVLDINDHQKKRFTKKIIEAYFNTLKDKNFAILGFAFKKNTRSTKDSPAIYVCKSLLEEGARLSIYDPVVSKTEIMEELKKACNTTEEKTLISTVTVCNDPYDATENTHGVVICTDWDVFNNLDFYRIYNGMVKPPYIFDGRKMLPHKELMEIGFNVQTIGKNLNPVPNNPLF